MEMLFATGNKGKVEEMQPLMPEGARLKRVDVDIDEIDALDVEDVARRKAIDSFNDLDSGKPIIVEDTGFYVEGLGGFPGAKAAYFDRTVGAHGLIPLLENRDDRSAYFKTAIAHYDGSELKVFTGRSEGRVPDEPRGESHPHLPYNTFFVPSGENESFAENPDLIHRYSHREEATRKFVDWLSDR